VTEYHEPVLLDEVVRWIGPKAFGTYVDCTAGGGAHAEGMLATVAGRANLLGLDRDPEAIAAAERRLAPFGDAVRLRHAPFSRLAEVAREEKIAAADGILFDLGVSSAQIDRPARGMTYRIDAPLDLRMDPTSGESAADLLARLDERAIADVLFRFGEEPRGRAIARRIAGAPRRPRTTGELAAIVRAVAPHPAEKTLSRVFQALRIAVNRELEEIEAALPQAVDLLAEGGTLAVISYHSLEDRIVKQFIRSEAKGCVCPPGLPVCVCGRAPRLEAVSRRAIRPTPQEVSRNRRARSARLRVARRLPSPPRERTRMEAP
jgi:16S rRNA (cytosine1402-N4)-methyltransferase